MNQRLLSLFTLLLPLTLLAQNGRTFRVEELSKPEKALRLAAADQMIHRLVLSGLHLSEYEVKKNNLDIRDNVVARSKGADSLVDFGYHAFFNGMYQAYADHRPFVLSPDMIWLLVSQGFARHINNHPEAYRDTLAGFRGKVTLTVKDNRIDLANPNSPWDEVFPRFTGQIDRYTPKGLVQTLEAGFSTSTPASRVATQITVMEAMKPYFEFVVLRIVCGIPQITLEGTPQDWQQLLDRTEALRPYGLAWWTDELKPLLQEFARASKGSVDTAFWRNMFKYHSQQAYGAPKVIDGWIVKFFPYNKDGKRNNLREIMATDQLPNEIVKVDLDFLEGGTDGNFKKVPLELWAGFFGLEQARDNGALKPQIGWLVRRKDSAGQVRVQQLRSAGAQDFGGINIRVQTFPPELLELPAIKKLEISFVDEIQVPDAIAKIKIDRLVLKGRITEGETERIRKLLPHTELIINNKTYSTP